MVSIAEVEKLALTLPDSERALLASHLLGSLPSILDDEDEGIAEALRRDAEMDANPAFRPDSETARRAGPCASSLMQLSLHPQVASDIRAIMAHTGAWPDGNLRMSSTRNFANSSSVLRSDPALSPHANTASVAPTSHAFPTTSCSVWLVTMCYASSWSGTTAANHRSASAAAKLTTSSAVPTPALTSSAAVLLVRDVLAAARYYCDQLGFTHDGFFNDPPDFCILRRDGWPPHAQAGRRPGARRPTLDRSLPASATSTSGWTTRKPSTTNSARAAQRSITTSAPSPTAAASLASRTSTATTSASASSSLSLVTRPFPETIRCHDGVPSQALSS